MKTALLLIDLQNDYFEGGTMTLVNADKAINNAKLILDKFRKDHLTVIHIQHIATNPAATFFLPDTKGSEIHLTLQPLVEEKVIIKHYPNSFRETQLLSYLKDNAVTNLVICGMMTHMCVDTTTRAAHDLGFICTLIGDACATKNLEIFSEKVIANDVQTAFLAALNSTFANVVTAKIFLGL